MVKCTCNKKNCKKTYNKADLKRHLQQNAAGAASRDTTIDKKIVMQYYGKPLSEIASATGKSVERIKKIIRKIDGVKKKETCREYFENGKSEHEAASNTGLTLARVKRIYDRCRKKKGSDITPSTSPEPSNEILSINGQTLFQIKCETCGKNQKQKIHIMYRPVRTPSGMMILGLEMEAGEHCECGAFHSIKVIPDDVSS
jgi:hypothetical protein